MTTESFNAVKGWLEKNGHNWKAGNIKEIRWALEDIIYRLRKVRCISPTCDLTERMWALMERAGITPIPIKQKRPNLLIRIEE